MNKTELKEKWGTYTDTDKLVDDIMEVLTTYRHRNTEHGVCVLLDTYFTNKQPLIEMFKKIDGFGADLRFTQTKEFDRNASRGDIQNALYRIENMVNNSGLIISKIDDDGKTFADYLKLGFRHFNIAQLEDYEFVKKLNTRTNKLKSFNSSGYTNKSVELKDKFINTTHIFYDIIAATLKEEDATRICEKLNSKKYTAGLKTSRAFNRMCEEFGVTKHKDYNKLFAVYADMVTGGTREFDFVISLNPYDYLTMSFGKSWSSCHTIDKNNVRGMPNSYSGQYCGGTLSYMLDKTSIITYVLDKGGDPKTHGKIYRNMFHYENDILIQARIYPQGNDGATDLYTKFREYMHEALKDVLELSENKWIKSTKSCSTYANSSGTHYRDYEYYNGCNVTYPAEKEKPTGVVHIGHEGICVHCGETYTSSGHLTHGSCVIR